MCGIAGIISFKNQVNICNKINQMVTCLGHRGPDDLGIWNNRKIAFGMSRLSIIGLENGKQPMWHKNQVAIVFNGEIYNYKDLQIKINPKNQRRGQESDTAIILEMYLKYGIQFISKINGMFAIAIFDFVKNKVFLVRDRLGVKPIYYFCNPNKLIFASEIKALVKTFPGLKKINMQAVHDFLTYRFIPGPQTIWEKIKSLPASSILELNLKNQKFKIYKYWTIQWKTRKYRSQLDLQNNFNSLFLNSVDLRVKAADVPVGVLLSGGLDSSSIVAAANHHGHKNLTTFSVSFLNSKNIDESKFAKQVAQKYKTKHISLKITLKDFLNKINEVIYALDQPLADLASVPLYFICAEAKKYVKVLLSGEGADEILAGYNLEKIAWHFEIIKKTGLFKIVPDKLKENKNVLKIFDPASYFKQEMPYSTQGFSENEKNHLWKNKINLKTSSSFLKAFYKNLSYENFLSRFQECLIKQWLIEDLLMKMDKISMHHSLEVREPFLDYRLVKWATGIPQSVKLGKWPFYKSKNLLRNFAKDKLPKEVLSRKKMGFPTPANTWLQGPLKTDIYNELTASSSKISRLFKTSEIKKLFNLSGSIQEKNLQKIWNLFFLERWMKIWC